MDLQETGTLAVLISALIALIKWSYPKIEKVLQEKAKELKFLQEKHLEETESIKRQSSQISELLKILADKEISFAILLDILSKEQEGTLHRKREVLLITSETVDITPIKNIVEKYRISLIVVPTIMRAQDFINRAKILIVSKDIPDGSTEKLELLERIVPIVLHYSEDIERDLEYAIQRSLI